jgi:hypothetical protein
MPSHAWLDGEAFDPETTEMMGGVYNEAIKRLGPATPPLVLETVASRIIEATRRGERDPQAILRHAIIGLDPSATDS